MKTFLVVLLIIHITLSVYSSIRANRFFINKKRLWLNYFMIISIPFIWSLLIISLTSKPKNKKDDGYRYMEAGYKNWTERF